MASFEELRRQTHILAKDMSHLTGVPCVLVHNIIQYARSLGHPNKPDGIDELVFVAQMGIRFGITSMLHSKLMFDALKINHSKYVRLEDYVRLVCLFISTKLDLKIDFVFSVYDTTHSNCLDRKGLAYLLRPSIINTSDDSDLHESLKELVEVVLNVFDTNNDGAIGLEEYRKAVKSNILYIQLLGQVLPTYDDLQTFLTLIKYKSPLEVRSFFENERAKCLSEPVYHRDTTIQSLYPIVLDMP